MRSREAIVCRAEARARTPARPGRLSPPRYSVGVPASRSATTTAAAALTALSGLGFAGVGVAVVASRWAVFSVGVAVVLIVYALLVLAIAVLLWRQRRQVFGAAVAASLLHLLVLGNLAAGDHRVLFLTLALVPLAALGCLLATPTRRDLGRG